MKPRIADAILVMEDGRCTAAELRARAFLVWACGLALLAAAVVS